MTKQEEIREGIYGLFFGCFVNMTSKIPNEQERGWLNAYTEQMGVYLHSQGVVIGANGFYGDLMESLIEEGHD